MSDTRNADGDTYEMFWDCKFCRTPKLLGLTHRHCPVCGAPQNAAERYFPTDADKVRVADHRYVGRDSICSHCGTYNSRNSLHCRDCGAPTAEGTAAQVLPDHADGTGVQMLADTTQARATGARPRLSRIIGLVVVALVAAVALLFLWKKEQAFAVTGHSWERRIDIERFGPVRDSAWCDQVPSGGHEVRRYRAVRSHEQISDGETCTTRKVDQGDGTFREVRDCKPRYKTRDIEGDRCDYEVNRWTTARFVESKGLAASPPPTWPPLPQLANCGRVGCERAGARRETYSVLLSGPDSNAACNVSQASWLEMSVGRRYRAKVRVVGGGVDCASLNAD
jgi:ribosomal protein L40E